MVSALRATGEFSLILNKRMTISTTPMAIANSKAAMYRSVWAAGLEGAGNATPPVPGIGASVRDMKKSTSLSHRLAGKCAIKITAKAIKMEPM